jgi:hypothetical protein
VLQKKEFVDANGLTLNGKQKMTSMTDTTGATAMTTALVESLQGQTIDDAGALLFCAIMTETCSLYKRIERDNVCPFSFYLLIVMLLPQRLSRTKSSVAPPAR